MKKITVILSDDFDYGVSITAIGGLGTSSINVHTFAAKIKTGDVLYLPSKDKCDPFSGHWDITTPPSNRLMGIALDHYNLKNIDGYSAQSIMDKIIKKELGKGYTIVKE